MNVYYDALCDAHYENPCVSSQTIQSVTPPAIFCIGLNYKDHAQEAGLPIPKFPVHFMKPPSCVVGSGDEIVIPAVASSPNEVDYEGEMAVIIGKTVKNASIDEAGDAILGFTAANDVSARRWQGKKGGGQWCRGKSFDTFLPLGPSLLPAREIGPSPRLSLTTRVNGEVLQSSCTSNMVWNVPEIVAFLSQDTTLQAGTVILTGTPPGVGYAMEPPRFLAPGDVVEVELEGAGVLRNVVVNSQ